MKKFLFVSVGICIAHLLNAQNNVFNLPVQINDGTQGIGKVFTSDASGLGSWQTQNNWLVNGNYLSGTSTIGSINNDTLKLITNDIDRIIIGTSDTMQFKGVSIFDTLIVPVGYIYADSIRARVIHVGDSSITIGTAPPPALSTINGSLPTSEN